MRFGFQTTIWAGQYPFSQLHSTVMISEFSARYSCHSRMGFMSKHTWNSLQSYLHTYNFQTHSLQIFLPADLNLELTPIRCWANRSWAAAVWASSTQWLTALSWLQQWWWKTNLKLNKSGCSKFIHKEHGNLCRKWTIFGFIVIIGGGGKSFKIKGILLIISICLCSALHVFCTFGLPSSCTCILCHITVADVIRNIISYAVGYNTGLSGWVPSRLQRSYQSN